LVDAAHVHVLLLHEKPPAHPASAQQSSPSVPQVLASGIASWVAASLVSVVASVGAESGDVWSPGATWSCVASPPPSGCFALASGVVPVEPVPAQPQTIAAAISPMARHATDRPIAPANSEDASG
jgi:hypothetical protein